MYAEQVANVATMTADAIKAGLTADEDIHPEVMRAAVDRWCELTGQPESELWADS